MTKINKEENNLSINLINSSSASASNSNSINIDLDPYSILREITNDIFFILFYFSDCECNINEIMSELIKSNLPQIILEKFSEGNNISYNNNEEINIEKSATILISNFIFYSNQFTEVRNILYFIFYI